MKIFWLGILLWMSIPGTICVAAADAGVPDELEQAQGVVSTFLGALAQGDVDTISQSLGGGFLRKKERLLKNPDYPASLVELYSGSSYEITRVERTADGKVAVDVELDMGQSGKLGTRFMVDRITDSSTGQGKYLIIDEID